MRGMDTVIALRQQRVQPAAVMVELVDSIIPGGEPLSNHGIVTVEIPRADDLSSIDFRPLVGLHVQVFDFADDLPRHRRACALIAEVNPRILAMPIRDGERFTLHIRRNGQTETYTS